MTFPLFTRSHPPAACGFALLLILAFALVGCGDGAAAPEARISSVAVASASDAAETYEFDVQGMHCEGCVISITSAVEKLPGVQSVEVALEAERATVHVAEGGADPAAIIAAIDGRGYTATLATETAPATQPSDLNGP